MTEAAATHSGDPSSVRARYQAVEAHARFMLAAARVSDWPLFWQLETECTGLVQALKACPAPTPDAAWAAERHEMLLRLLRTDAHIRELLLVQHPAQLPVAQQWLH